MAHALWVTVLFIISAPTYVTYLNYRRAGLEVDRAFRGSFVIIGNDVLGGLTYERCGTMGAEGRRDERQSCSEFVPKHGL